LLNKHWASFYLAVEWGKKLSKQKLFEDNALFSITGFLMHCLVLRVHLIYWNPFFSQWT